MLVEREALVVEILQDALTRRGMKKIRLGDFLIAEGLVDETILYRTLAEQWGLEFLDELPVKEIDLKLLETYPLEHLRRFRIVPVHLSHEALYLVTSEPAACGPLDEMSLEAGLPLHLTVMAPSKILQILQEIYGKGRSSHELIDTLTIEEGVDGDLAQIQVEDVLASANKAPVVKFVNTLIFQALRENASDIHLEMSPESFRIRYRIDGVLTDRFFPPRALHAPVISRIKIMSGLDIAERRLPQDGKIRVKFGDREVDIRVSCVPSAFGERVVLRLLDRKSELITLEQMGMEADTLLGVDRLLRRPNGIFLVTGPTGSGKTTTLYGSIMRIMGPGINIITLEDPVEYELEGASQIPVKPRIGFTFAAGLRSILRQDPDVIMVGEIRDEETAAMAIQSSLTGHLVFSTLHTNDAASAPVRLIDMKVEPYLVSSTLIGVLAQRLVRRVCPACRKGSKTCEICNGSGFKGRLGIFELMTIDEEMAGRIGERIPLEELRALARKKGMRILFEDGQLKVQAGLTTREEVERVCWQGD